MRLPELAAIAESEPETAVQVMVEAARMSPRQPPRTFEGAARQLGANGLCRALLRGVMPQRFAQQPGDDAIDVEAFWWQANLRGACAAHLARQCQPDLLAHAYPAAYLSQVGRLALELAPESPEAASTVFLHAGAGVAALDMEQRRFGADHALAGKWVLEAWGLPRAWAEAVWLQYHPAGTLDHTSYPVALAELVGLANRLVTTQLTGQQEAFLESAAPVAERLGLSLAALRAAAHTDYEQLAEELEPLDVSFAEAAAELHNLDPAELMTRLEWAETINGLYEATAEMSSETAVLLEIVRRLRSLVPCEAGLCILTGPQGGITSGAIWRGEAEAGLLPISAQDGNDRTSSAIRRLLDSIDGAALGIPGHEGGGMVALPIGGAGRVYGQFVLEAAKDAPPTAQRLARIDHFIHACVSILRRVEGQRLNARREEEAGAAILKQEAAHRKLLRKARLESVGRMAAGAAHEINNPLAVISGRAQLLLGRAADAEQAQALETIVQQSRRVSRIISDLMQFARPDAPKFAPVSLSQLLHQCYVSLAPRAAEQQVRVVEDYASGLPLVEADRHQMSQVFTHLITNALQAMPDGGMLTLRVKAGLHTPSVVVQIEDTGLGIQPEHMDRIFEPFFSGRPMGQAGTGLGLSVSLSIVERHFGTMAMQSQPGEGCTCTMRFPASGVMEAIAPAIEAKAVAEAEAVEATAVEVSSAHVPGQPRIVVCESNEDAREVLLRTLEGRGYRVTAVHDGLEALALLLTEPADILLCDLQETALGGIPLITQVSDRFPELAIVAFSTQLSSEIVSDPLCRLVRATVHKPFHLDTLFAALDNCLGARRRMAQ